jgi:outer membrane immunogenic protein
MGQGKRRGLGRELITGQLCPGGKVVTGLEADFNSLSFHKSSSLGGPVPVGGLSFAVTTAVDTSWLATARGRLGWEVTPGYLIYATGGLAVTEIKVSNSFADNFAPVVSGTSSTRKTKAGWTIGGGIEAALQGNWTVKAEYLYVNFGSVSTTFATNTVAPATVADVMTTSADLRASIVRVGFNYKFH